MIQNTIIKAGNNSLVISANNTSEFSKWIVEKFSQPTDLSSSLVKGIMNVFDRVGHEGAVFRGALIEWLWENQGKEAIVTIE